MQDQLRIAESRVCLTCACHFAQKHPVNPLESQSFCRLKPPMAQQMRAETPRMRDGKPVMDRHDKPVMEAQTVIVYLYAPTQPGLTCFDGWRSLGTLPGEREFESPNLLDTVVGAMKKLSGDLETNKEFDALEAAKQIQ
jgi:hypothetical protein